MTKPGCVTSSGIHSLPPSRFAGGGRYSSLPRLERRRGLTLFVRLISGVRGRGKVDPPSSQQNSHCEERERRGNLVRVKL